MCPKKLQNFAVYDKIVESTVLKIKNTLYQTIFLTILSPYSTSVKFGVAPVHFLFTALPLVDFARVFTP